MNCGIKRILQFDQAIVYQSIKVLDGNGQDITNICRYSWSSDGVCWTNWVDYNNYSLLARNLETDFYFRVLLYESFSKIYLNGVQNKCYSICFDNSNPFVTDLCGSENLFQPYNNLDCALQLQQQMADSVICMLGIPIYYMKVDPVKATADLTFKEYVMHNVSAVKQLKLMIPDGTMPSSNPKMTEFDFDWEVDWEVELSKTQFANAFGDSAYPRSRDIIYIPMMKRMWCVNSAYDEKNESLLWRSTTWKLALVKYDDGTNVEVGEYEDFINSVVANKYEELFQIPEHKEQIRESGTDQVSAPKFAATNLFDIFMEDSIRKQYTKDDATVLDKMYCHNNNVVARNIYKFKNDNGCVTYQNSFCGEEGSIMFILETPGSMNETVDKEILNFGPIDISVAFSAKENKFFVGCHELLTNIDPFSTYMIIYRWSRKNVTSEFGVYKYTHREDVPVYRLTPEMYRFDFENPVCELIGIYNNDYIVDSSMDCQIHGWPAMMTNIKYYNKYLTPQEAIKESLKYTTNHENCVINDLARPISSGHGYAVR